MKKAYSKPRVYIESFRLVEHIASGCIGAYNQHDQEHVFLDATSCMYVDLGTNESYFLFDSIVCEDADSQPIDMDDLYLTCYQGPSGSSAKPFSS